jgi:hypothetical protein
VMVFRGPSRPLALLWQILGSESILRIPKAGFA